MQHFIVVSSPCPVEQEATHINQLFGAGMALFHLRKPGCGEDALQDLLAQIDPQYYDRIALHQHHHLAPEPGIKRLHFPEASRLQQTEPALLELAASGFTLSTSIHNKASYNQLPHVFAYTFLGPFAPSISKPGYGLTKGTDVSSIRRQNTRIIALGGLQADNLLEPVAEGFDGVAVLGSIWKDKNITDNFKQLQNIWLTADRP